MVPRHLIGCNMINNIVMIEIKNITAMILDIVIIVTVGYSIGKMRNKLTITGDLRLTLRE